MQETWKYIEGFNNMYQVSNLGNVKSYYSGEWKNLKEINTKKGYVFVNLKKNKKLHNIKIHRLVAQTFIPNPNNKPQVNHIDGNKTNNTLTNLEWVTCQENVDHAWENGLMGDRKRRPPKTKPKMKRNKLKEDEVIEILKMLKTEKYTQPQIAKKYGVCQQSVSHIKCNRNYKYINI